MQGRSSKSFHKINKGSSVLKRDNLLQIICKNATLYTDMVLKANNSLELYPDDKGFRVSDQVS